MAPRPSCRRWRPQIRSGSGHRQHFACRLPGTRLPPAATHFFRSPALPRLRVSRPGWGGSPTPSPRAPAGLSLRRPRAGLPERGLEGPGRPGPGAGGSGSACPQPRPHRALVSPAPGTHPLPTGLGSRRSRGTGSLRLGLQGQAGPQGRGGRAGASVWVLGSQPYCSAVQYEWVARVRGGFPVVTT